MIKVVIVSILALVLIAGVLYLYFVHAPRLNEPALTSAARVDRVHMNGYERTYTSYHPVKTKPRPALVIVLHGTNIDGPKIREWTGFEFDQMADQYGFLVAYPDGYGADWNDCRKGDFSKTKKKNMDDVGFIKALISRYVTKYEVDPARVYLFGYSSGGNMAFRMGMEHPELIAGITAVCAALPTMGSGICKLNGAMPKMMLVNGTADKICPIDGGELNLFGRKLGKVISAQATADFFANSHGINAAPVKMNLPHLKAEDPTSVNRLTWSKNGHSIVELYVVNNGGHVVPQPNAKYPSIMGRLTGDLDTPVAAISFFGLQL